MEIWDISRILKTVVRQAPPWSTPVEAHPRIVVRYIDVIFFRPKGHSIRDKYFVLLNMASVYHIVAIRVNETSWVHVSRLRFCYLRMGYDKWY
jgi:hypothetical protein